MDEDPNLTDPIINDDEEVFIDLEGELEATPALKDETTKTAIQKCQEREEKKLWDEIVSTTTTPNAETMSGEEKRAEAENYKRLGFCDKSYYGEEGCRGWKRKLDPVPLRPEARLELESQLQEQFELCPSNLIILTDCQRPKQSVYMRFAILDETAKAVWEIPALKTRRCRPWSGLLDAWSERYWVVRGTTGEALGGRKGSICRLHSDV
ncbi:MAG: hypothetical protein Q9221_007991 [Calogaya cf. arnoldii]